MLSFPCFSGKLWGLMMRERPSRAWSFFKKGATYPSIRVIKIKAINTQQQPGQGHQEGSVSCGFPCFPFLKEGWQGPNKTKIPYNAFVWQYPHWAFIWLVCVCRWQDFKHSESTERKNRFCPKTLGTPAQPFIRVKCISPQRGVNPSDN